MLVLSKIRLLIINDIYTCMYTYLYTVYSELCKMDTDKQSLVLPVDASPLWLYGKTKKREKRMEKILLSQA